jgi:hypothetical protein
LKMSNETGISAYKIYKWLDGKGKPKHEDAVKIGKWLGPNVEVVPNAEAPDGNHNGATVAVITEGKTEITYLERLLEKEEARRIEAQRDKDKLLTSNELLARALEKLGTIYEKIADSTSKTKESVTKILANSNEALDRLEKILVVDRSDHKVTLGSLDRLEHQPEGSNQKESNRIQLETEKRLRKQNKGKTDPRKKGN